MKIRRRAATVTKSCVLHNQTEGTGREGESDRGTGEGLSDRHHHCIFDGSEHLKKLNKALICPRLHDTVRVGN